MLKMKFAGRAAYDPKKGELTLIYDFKEKNQLKDFELKDAMLTVKGGVLRISPADSIKHIVKFKSLNVTGQFVVENIGSSYVPFLQTSAGISFGTAEGGIATGLVLFNGKVNLGHKILGRDATEGKPISLNFKLTEKRASAKVQTWELAGPNEGGAAGQVEFLGSKGGLQVRSLVISGTLDADWAREFFGK
jgi:hypothetical protein